MSLLRIAIAMGIVAVTEDAAIHVSPLVRELFTRKQSLDCLPQAPQKGIGRYFLSGNVGNRGNSRHAWTAFFLAKIVQCFDQGADLLNHHRLDYVVADKEL